MNEFHMVQEGKEGFSKLAISLVPLALTSIMGLLCSLGGFLFMSQVN